MAWRSHRVNYGKKKPLLVSKIDLKVIINQLQCYVRQRERKKNIVCEYDEFSLQMKICRYFRSTLLGGSGLDFHLVRLQMPVGVSELAILACRTPSSFRFTESESEVAL